MEEYLVMLAKEHVLQGFKKNEVMLSKISALDEPLNNLYWSRRPDAQDYDNRRDLVRIFNAIAREIYGDNSNNCPVVEEFGSFLMDMFDVKSDLDLSINFASKRAGSRYTEKVKHLRKFAAKLYALQERKLVRNVQPILTAKVPVLKVTDCGTGIECDLSVKNMDGIAKSRFILMISAIDDRFQKLCFLVRKPSQFQYPILNPDILSTKAEKEEPLGIRIGFCMSYNGRAIYGIPCFLFISSSASHKPLFPLLVEVKGEGAVTFLKDSYQK